MSETSEATRSSFERVAELVEDLWEAELADFRAREAEIEEREEAARSEIARLREEAAEAEREAAMLKSELSELPELLMRASLEEDPEEEQRVRSRYSELAGATEGLQARSDAAREELRSRFGENPEAYVEAIHRETFPLIDEATELWQRIGEEHDWLVRLLGERYSELRGRTRAVERSQRERRAYLEALRRG